MADELIRPTDRPLQKRPTLIVGESKLLPYLPGLYRGDPFMGRFLKIFETVWQGIEGFVENGPLYTEPHFAPREFLPWLHSWVALSEDNAWPEERRRVLISLAVEIYRWRGTRRGLALHIAAYTGAVPLIQEFSDGFTLGPQNALGVTTALGRPAPNAASFVVTVPAAQAPWVEESVLRTIIEEDKPAHATYVLRVLYQVTAARERVL